MEERVRAAFDRFRSDGPEAISELLDPDVELLAPQPGPWDCRGRDAVIRFLHGYLAAGPVAQVIEVTEHGDRLLLGLYRPDPDGGSGVRYSVLTLAGDRLRRMQGFPSRPAALVSIYGVTIQGLASVGGDEIEYVDGPWAGRREPREDLPDEIAAPGGWYRRTVACADDRVTRYRWTPAAG